MDKRTRAFKFFDEMEAGKVLSISAVAPNDPVGFTQYIKEYIDFCGLLTVSDDWQRFRKEEPPSCNLSARHWHK